MADNQVHYFNNSSTKDPSKNKKPFSSTLKNFSLKKPLQVSGISKTSDLDSELLNKPSNPLTSIRNAPSPATSPSEAESWKASASPPKCKELSSSEETIFTTSPSTTDTKRDTETSLFTAHPLSLWRKVTLSWSANADPCARPWASTCLKSFPTKSSVTSENSSCSSDLYNYLTSLFYPFWIHFITLPYSITSILGINKLSSRKLY